MQLGLIQNVRNARAAGLFALLMVACSSVPDDSSLTSDAEESTGSYIDNSTADSNGGTGTSTSAGPPGSSGGGTTGQGATSPDPATETDSADCVDDDCSSGTEPAMQECDIVAQDCDEGEKCTPYASDGGPFWDGTKCVPIPADPVPPGKPCMTLDGPTSGLDNCDGNGMCYDVDPETQEGVCVEFCYGENYPFKCSDPLAQCHWANDGVLAVCLTDCDPMEQDCKDDQGCYPNGDGDGFGCDWDASNGQGVGKPCELHKECPGGMFCAPGMHAPACEGESCCAEFCDPNGDSSDCWGANEGVSCVPLGQIADGFAPEDVGVCVAP